jgi:hypothetical protein
MVVRFRMSSNVSFVHRMSYRCEIELGLENKKKFLDAMPSRDSTRWTRYQQGLLESWSKYLVTLQYITRLAPDLLVLARP